MKEAIFNRTKLAGLAVAAIAAFVGCDKDNEDGTIVFETGALSVNELIFNPKSPQPGDTVSFTMVVSSSSDNITNFPAYEWSADGGTFLETKRQTVRWVAPASSEIYTVTAKAVNSVNSSSRNAKLFVSSPRRLVVMDAGQIFLEDGDTTFVYLNTEFGPAAASVYRYTSASNTMVTGNPFPGDNYSLAPDLSLAASTLAQDVGQDIPTINVNGEDLAAGTWQTLTQDGIPDDWSRRQQYTNPQVSPDGDLIAYSVFRPTKFVGLGVDTFDIEVFDATSSTTQNVTRTHGLARRNYFPTFSSDQNWIVFVSDRNVRNVWELYGMPMVGGRVVDTDSSSVRRLTETGGLIATGSQSNVVIPTMVWNPNPATPVMAHINKDGDALLRLIQTTVDTAMTTEVVGIAGAVQELVWNRDGSMLAVATGSELYSVTLGRGREQTPRGSQWRPASRRCVVARRGVDGVPDDPVCGGLVRVVRY